MPHSSSNVFTKHGTQRADCTSPFVKLASENKLLEKGVPQIVENWFGIVKQNKIAPRCQWAVRSIWTLVHVNSYPQYAWDYFQQIRLNVTSRSQSKDLCFWSKFTVKLNKKVKGWPAGDWSCCSFWYRQEVRKKLKWGIPQPGFQSLGLMVEGLAIWENCWAAAAITQVRARNFLSRLSWKMKS